MAGGGYRNSFIDVVNDSYVAGTVSVGTTEVKACVGANNLIDRQELNIYNPTADTTIYFGPTGVTTTTGIPIEPGEVISLQYGDKIDVYLIAGTAGNTIILQEAS